MRSIKLAVRWVLLIGGIIAFIFALHNLLRWMYEGGHFLAFIGWSFIGAFAFLILLLMHNAETYPERERQERRERDLENHVRQLRIR